MLFPDFYWIYCTKSTISLREKKVFKQFLELFRTGDFKFKQLTACLKNYPIK